MQGAGSMPGEGGVSRGPGDAELIWGSESSDRSDLFEARSLEAARFLDEDQNRSFGVGATAPEVDPQAEGAGLVEVQPTRGGAAWTRRIAPRHRDAVSGFFGSTSEPERGSDAQTQDD